MITAEQAKANYTNWIDSRKEISIEELLTEYDHRIKERSKNRRSIEFIEPTSIAQKVIPILEDKGFKIINYGASENLVFFGANWAEYTPETVFMDTPTEKCQNCGNKDVEDYHNCPYQSEINGDDNYTCNCCDDCSNECAMSI